MPVSDTERPARAGAELRLSLSGFQPLASGSTSRRHVSLLRELEGVGQQVLDDLLQPLGVGDQVAFGRSGSISMAKSTPLDSATWRKVRST